MSFEEKTIFELTELIQKKEVKAAEITESFIERIQSQDGEVNSFVKINETALDDAKKVDEKLSRGESLGPLAGVPIAVKDLLCTKNLRTTAASKMLENFVPPYDATVVERLRQAGAIILGKTNLDEFAMGSSNEVSHFGICRNPWNREYVAGGSSGGSAASVAAGFASASIGTDTGGSIRQPASFCGVVGVKPTYGRVSRYGIIAFASSLDQAGPMAKTVKESALLLEAISGKDERDATSSPQEVPRWSQEISSDIKGMKIGLPKEYFSEEIDPEVRESVEKAIEVVKSQGAECVEVSLPHLKYSIPVYYLIATSEASSNLARYDGVRYGYRHEEIPSSLDEFYSKNRGIGFGDEVKRRIMLGTYALSSGYYDAYYKKAGQVRRLIKNQFEEIFKQCQVVLGPVSNSPAFKIGERINDPLTMYLNDIFTTVANLAGIPGMSVPSGFSKGGLPIGVQLMSSHFDENSMFRVAMSIEENSETEKRRPHVV